MSADATGGAGGAGGPRAHVLTLNAGSSSIKFGLFEAGAEPALVASGLVERIGEAGAARIKARSAEGTPLAERGLDGAEAENHTGALTAVLGLLREHHPDRPVAACGHRVVHGGPDFAQPVRVDDAILAALARFEPFAPLHQPHNLAGIRAARAAFPEAAQVACFDTAFHRSHPWVNDVFALPREYLDRGVRRYGFHGLSYEYIAGALAAIAPQIHAGRVVVAHLGNGASMCGLLGGRSIGSTMGFTALDGLPMGTRCGQIDPGVILYLLEQEGLSTAEVTDLLYKRSGLLGLSGVSNDMRALEGSDAPEAAQAIDYFVFRVRRELGALAAVLGGIDALVFTAGIGENSVLVRERVCEGLGWLGLELDHARNGAREATLPRGARLISADLSRARIFVIPTDEEAVIARAASALMADRPAAMEATR